MTVPSTVFVLPETSLNTITFLHTPIVRMPPGSANETVAVLLSSVVENVIVYDWGRFYHYFDQ